MFLTYYKKQNSPKHCTIKHWHCARLQLRLRPATQDHPAFTSNAYLSGGRYIILCIAQVPDVVQGSHLATQFRVIAC